jgi:hypothetical protein
MRPLKIASAWPSASWLARRRASGDSIDLASIAASPSAHDEPIVGDRLVVPPHFVQPRGVIKASFRIRRSVFGFMREPLLLRDQQ